MIHVIVFSYNRALQVDTLLSSFFEHWKSPSVHVDVLYNTSSLQFEKGYDILKDKYNAKDVSFVRESLDVVDKVKLVDFLNIYNLVRLYRFPKLRHPKSNFRSLLIELMENTKSDSVMFLTDDSMFINDIEVREADLDWINAAPENRQFSLRLGKGENDLPSSVSDNSVYCNWNMYENIHSWGYPFSVDSHIYNKEYILRLFRKYLFINPNTLEANICGVVKRKRKLGLGRCFSNIKMLTFPINIVQDCINNICQDVSVEMLNQKLLEGCCMRYEVPAKFDATKQYVESLIFTDASGKITKVQIDSNPNSRPNSKQ